MSLLQLQDPFTKSLLSDEFMPVWIVAIAALAGVVIFFQHARHEERKKRMEIVRAALENPSLSSEAKQELTRTLRPQPGRALFVIGWFGAFAGVAWMCVATYNDEFNVALALTIASGACITLPLALRELEARRA